MKHLLVAINAKYIHSSLSVRTISNYLKQKDVSVDFKEYTINQPIGDILRELHSAKAESYMFSCYLWNIDYVKRLVVNLNKLLPKSKIVLGGPEASYKAESLLKELPFVRAIAVGEGEETTMELLEAFDGSKPLENITGLHIYNGNTGARKPINMDELAFNYPDIAELDHRILYYESTRGCPFNCSYCLSSVEKGVRARSLDLVFRDLEVFIKAGIRQLKFVDRTFNYDDKRAMKIWQYLIDNDNGRINFHFEISADILSTTAIELLATAREGLFQFEIGVQSTNPHTLKEIQRVTNLNLIKERVETLSEPNNIHLHLDLIAGLPYEDFQSFKKSFNWIYALRPQQFQLGFLKVLGGSLMEIKTKEYDLLYNDDAPFQILQNKWLSFEDLSLLEDVEHMVDHYYNSGRYNHTINYLISKNYDNSFDFFYELAADYKSFKGEGPLSKTGYYDLIGAFCENHNIEIDDTLIQLCRLDIMLHEKPKKYPIWASSSKISESEMNFFDDKSMLEKYLPEYSHDNPKQLSRITHLEFFSIDPFSLKVGKTAFLADYSQKDIINQAKLMRINEI